MAHFKGRKMKSRIISFDDIVAAASDDDDDDVERKGKKL